MAFNSNPSANTGQQAITGQQSPGYGNVNFHNQQTFINGGASGKFEVTEEMLSINGDGQQVLTYEGFYSNPKMIVIIEALKTLGYTFENKAITFTDATTVEIGNTITFFL